MALGLTVYPIGELRADAERRAADESRYDGDKVYAAFEQCPVLAFPSVGRLCEALPNLDGL